MSHVQGQGSLVTASPGTGREASLREDKVSKGRTGPSTASLNFGAYGFLKSQTNRPNVLFWMLLFFSRRAGSLYGVIQRM